VTVIPKLAIDFTQYLMKGEDSGDPSSITRVLPIASVDVGLMFDRYFTVGESAMTQTLEPRMYYLYVPHKNQDNITLFDTGEYDFNISQLFRDNRFSGTDRVGDANRLSLAITSRIIEATTGLERLRGTLGTIVYFRDRKVQLTASNTKTESTSKVIGEIDGLISENLSFRSELQWDPHNDRWNNRRSFDRASASLVYGDEENRILNLAYRYRKDILEQVDVSARWPLFSGWTGFGRGQYSLKAVDHGGGAYPRQKQLLSGFFGVEKEACCWRVRVLGRWWRQNNVINRGLFVQLELKGFSSFGDNLDQFLMRELPGYRPPEDAAKLIRMPDSLSPGIQ
jgi:LPS-assembly protein